MSEAKLQTFIEMCADPSHPGVQSLTGLAQNERETLVSELKGRGLRVERLEGSKIHSKAELMDALEAACGLPSYFGKNWDALFDSLSNPRHWSKPVPKAGIVFLYTDSALLQTADQESLASFLEIIEDVQKGWRTEKPEFRFCVVLE